MNVVNTRIQTIWIATLAVAVSCIGPVVPAMAQEEEYEHGEDYTALLAQLPKTMHSLAEGVRQVSKSPEAAISAKFELKGGKLMLSVYTAGKGLEQDAERNVLKEHIGSPTGERWNPETKIFEDVAHVARSAQYVALMRMASVSLLDVIRTAAKEGTVFSVKPKVEHGEGRFIVLVAKAGRVHQVDYDLVGQFAGEHEEGEEKHGAAIPPLNPEVIEEASGVEANTKADGVVRIGWARDDVSVKVDGMAFPPSGGLGSWAAFKPTGDGEAMVMGDTVVFQDEVSPAMDAAFTHGLSVTALHNHFFFDEPKVYFMHIGGHGDLRNLAAGVTAVWDAIKQVRRENPRPAKRFGDGPVPQPGEGQIDPRPIKRLTGLTPSVNPGGVVKVTIGRDSAMKGMKFGGSMGLTTWAAFSGTDQLAAIDGDFAMTADEVQPVLRAMRKADIHVVALHNHMIGEEPAYYFVHFWATGPVEELAKGFKSVLDAQATVPPAGNPQHEP